MNIGKLALLAALSVTLGGLSACGGSADAPDSVVMSGNAYVKNSTSPLVGATVAVAEDPTLSTVTDANGAWSLAVPNGASVTVFLTHPEYLPTYSQTFETAGEAIDRVHFQMVPLPLFQALAAALDVVPDPGKCQLSTEVSRAEMMNMELPELVAARPTGVADVTVALDPPAQSITYFKFAQPFDLPDATLTATSESGGLVATQLDPGVYVVSATHASRRFESITVTCEPGRFINATVPRGLGER